jgi:hypothetical protein
MLASIEDRRSSDNVRQVEYWFPQLNRDACTHHRAVRITVFIFSLPSPRRRHTQRLSRQASFAKEIACSKDRNDCLFPSTGNDADLTVLDVENRIRLLPLRDYR